MIRGWGLGSQLLKGGYIGDYIGLDGVYIGCRVQGLNSLRGLYREYIGDHYRGH